MFSHKSINKDFFKNWSSNMSYVLGFFAADGYMTVNKRGGQFWSIQITDKELLEEIKSVIKAEHKIGVRKSKNLHEADQYRLQIGSIEMCNDLRNLGYSERKTNSLSIPNIPKEFFSHFVRGYFDGDGNVWVGYMDKGKGGKRVFAIQTIFTSCSLSFLTELRKRLERLNIIGGCVYKSKGSYARLQYSIKNSLKLYNFMYNELNKSKLFLARKKVKFEKYIKTIDNAVVV
jgi:intein-encoded DNA endonuclease-like protein